jgi:hypothetical protein
MGYSVFCSAVEMVWLILAYSSLALELTHIRLSAAADSSRDMAQSQFAMPTGQPQDYNKLFLAEKDNLELAEGLYTWVGADVERRVLEKYRKLQPLKSI